MTLKSSSQSRGMGAIKALKLSLGDDEFRKMIEIYRSPVDTPNRRTDIQKYADEVGVDAETLKRQIRDYLRGVPIIPSVAQLNSVRYSQELLKIVSDNIAYSGCWHVPNYDHRKLQAHLQDLKDKRIEDLVIVGDFGDYESFDTHEQLIEKDPRAVKVKDFKVVALDVLEEFLKVVRRIFILTGNHETKVLRACEGRFSWVDILSDKSMAKRVTMSPYPKAFIYSNSLPVIKWTMAIHFSGYSRNPYNLCNNALIGVVNPFADGAEKYITPNLIGSHTHGGFWAKNPNGVSVMAMLGTFADPDKTQYVWTSTRGYPAWTTSWVTFKNGRWTYETID